MRIRLEPIFCVAACSTPRQEAEQLALLAAALHAAGSQGFGRAWVLPDSGRAAPSDAIRMCVAAAADCPGLRCVAAGIDVERCSWIRLAEDAATADGLLASRLELCFGGAVPDPRPIGRIREAWAGGSPALPADAEARIEVHPRPAHPDGPPLWALAANADAARSAAHGELHVVVRDVESGVAFARAAAGDWSPEVAIDAESGASPRASAAELLRSDLDPLERVGIECVSVRVRVALRGRSDEAAAERCLEHLRELSAASRSQS